MSDNTLSHSLLFLPDISGFTNFVQTTEARHSQFVIAELLEILVSANTLNLELAEVEGDALFFYREEHVPSMERILAQVETMFTAFYGHLRLLEKNRVCPCNACRTAPNLQLKIIIHCGELQFITVQGKRKPFGKEVIEVHRLMKNSVSSDNYVLISSILADGIRLPFDYCSMLFSFQMGKDTYDGKETKYLYSVINAEKLNLKAFSEPQVVHFEESPSITYKRAFPVAADLLLENITNYAQRHHWVEGVDSFEYNENEITRIGTEHLCVVNGKYLNFVTVTKDAQPNQLIYGERTEDAPVVDAVYQFYIITPIDNNNCLLEVEAYLRTSSTLKRLFLVPLIKKVFKKNIYKAVNSLHSYVANV